MDRLIRKAAEADVGILAQMNKALILAEGSRNPMTIQQLEERMHGWLLGEWTIEVFQLNEAVIGYAVYQVGIDEYFPEESFVHLRQFYIGNEHRSKGYGSRVLKQLIKGTFPQGAKVMIDVLQSNPRGQSFWAKFGFEPYYTHMRLNT
jgi:GNAT superfamily N-acetyltransferase